jgi:hypothetical protein
MVGVLPVGFVGEEILLELAVLFWKEGLNEGA